MYYDTERNLVWCFFSSVRYFISDSSSMYLFGQPAFSLFFYLLLLLTKQIVLIRC
jgi:hypothetical protein